MLCTVNTQHASRQDEIITIRLYLATCFGRDRSSAGQLRTTVIYIKNSTRWDPNSFTLSLDKIRKFLRIFIFYQFLRIFIFYQFLRIFIFYQGLM